MPGAGSETMSASIGQSKMIGKQVYNPNATLVGTVADIGLVPGQKEITLQVRTAAGAIMDIKWEEISAVGDVVILSKEKEVPKMEVKPTPAAGAAATPNCPICGKPATWIPQYQRWYCYNDKKYL
jgi:sporulation protein YlmC with PRC-barrel domain